MIKEVIAFVDKCGDVDLDLQPSKSNGSEKKFIIIKTKNKDGSLEYDGLESLDSDDKTNGWLSNNKQYEGVIKNTDCYILPSALNKAMGSTSGLATYSFFVFKLSKKNLERFEHKINKTKFGDSRDNEVKIEEIHKILKDAMPDLREKSDDTFKYLEFHVVIHNKERFPAWKKIAEDFIDKRTAIGKKSELIKGECFVCKEHRDVSTPIFLTNYDAAKSFLKHTTRGGSDLKGIPLRACRQCIQKLNKFDEILQCFKIKIFPLFVEPDEISDEIKWLRDSLEQDENTFNFIFKQLESKQDKHIFDFYLVVKSAKYFFFDYVTGYKWVIGTYKDFFNEDELKITRQHLERKIFKVLSGSGNINYFDDKIKGKDSQQLTMIYSFRQKLFDFVYRNKNSLTVEDLRNIVLFRIEKDIRNNLRPNNETFNLFLNRNLLMQANTGNEPVFLDAVRKVKNDIHDKEFKINSDEEWAYFAGQIAYYLISLSKSKNKNYGLLEPFTNKSTTDLVKMTIEHLIERYRHEISLNNKRFKAIATKVLSYTTNQSFVELKIPFYIGAFDDNIIYYKKNVENGDA